MDRPLRATFHCRHYSYVGGMQGGPRCARDADLTAPLATKPCMPGASPKTPPDGCKLREEYTDAEREAWMIYRETRMEAQAKIMVKIPGSSRDTKKRAHWGETGSFGCPACDWGIVKWSRARNNGHLWAACSTPGCFGVQE
ncbi:hypothetical protein [Bradyrhizobium sp. USDA 4350]